MHAIRIGLPHFGRQGPAEIIIPPLYFTATPWECLSRFRTSQYFKGARVQHHVAGNRRRKGRVGISSFAEREFPVSRTGGAGGTIGRKPVRQESSQEGVAGRSIVTFLYRDQLN